MSRSSSVVIALVLFVPKTAAAFTFESPVSDGCHEAVTVAAVRSAGWPDGRVPPALTHDDELVARDLPYDVAGAKEDRWLLALTVGVRFNDLHGAEALDLPALAAVHNRAADQREHCLRSPSDDGPEGDSSALDACRGFILEQVDAALGEGDAPDLEAVEQVEVALAFHGPTRIEMNRYAFRIGRALHALQDAYTHMFRTPDGASVRHVLNFSEAATSSAYEPARDGHGHLSELDECAGTTPGRRRRELAIAASTELMAALADGAGGRDGRLARVATVLDAHLGYEPGCTADNAWCDAPERLEVTGCDASGGGSARWPAGLGWLGILWLALLLRHRRVSGVAAAAVFVVLVLSMSNDARADDPAEPGQGADVAGEHDAADGPVGIVAFAGAGIDRGAFAGRVGSRLRISESFELGFAAELNPWFSIEASTVVAGSLNTFATLVYRWTSAGRVTLRSTLHAGISVLLFDLIGAPAGSIGPFLGVSMLGVSIDLGSGFAFLIEPAEVMLPVPQVDGVPFYYRQYRFTVGMQWNP